MKKYMRVLILALALTALMCLPAFAGYDSCKLENDEVTSVVGFSQGVEKLTSITQTGVQADQQYLLLVLDDSYGVDYPTDDNILFVDQAQSKKVDEENVVTFNNGGLGVYPSAAKNSSVYLAGPGMKNAKGEDGPQKIATLGVSGVKVSGQVKSYNPNNATTVQLMKDGVEQYKTTIAAASGSGQVEQDFSIDSVNPDTYDLVVTKAGHLTYTITGVKVDADLNLTENTNAAIKLITLLAGDVNADGNINVTDLNTVWNASNYNKSTTAVGVASITDINGDGNVNVSDLNIVWNAANYNKIATTHCVISY